MKIKNLPLIVGIALPVLFILIVSIVIFAPSFFINPQYNFVYTYQNNYYQDGQIYKNNYKVEDGHIVLDPNILAAVNNALNNSTTVKYQADAPNLYLYDVKTNSSHQISFDDAKKLSVDPGPSSPDGYTVSYEYSNNGIFDVFGSNNNNGDGYFISKGDGRKKLGNLVDFDGWNRGSFRLIGWIK